ncbi:MAG TPA: T9SS type A sorting domain-containing protein [Candidatus Cloacimonadota bacterium]|nr:T9SS type A sorting domain-containing protein [Candidatus Cloacimonadota bacterium]
MKIFRALFIAVLVLWIGLISAQPQGELSQYGDKLVLKVWGSHYQRGYAQGYLLNQRIMNVFHGYYYTMFAFGSPTAYDYFWNWYQQHFSFHPRLYLEAEGLIDGIAASGSSLWHDGLQRNLTPEDVMQVNAVVDMIQIRNQLRPESPLELGCASLSSWGISTQQDSLLAGSAVITRFLDWSSNDALIANPLLVVHHPSENDEQKWMSFTFPGLLGALSAINESGTAAFLNMGNDYNNPSPNNLTHVLFDIRDGLELIDADDDGVNKAEDVYHCLAQGHHYNGTIIHALDELEGNPNAMVIETSNTNTVLRRFNQYGNLPGNHLAATNHFRYGGSTICCERYASIQDSLYANHQISAKRQWRVLSGAAGQTHNLSALQYTPSTGAILWTAATLTDPAWSNSALSLDREELFNFNVSSSDELQGPVSLSLKLWPNPVSRGQKLNIEAANGLHKVEIFNLRGQKVVSYNASGREASLLLDVDVPASGIYFLRVHDQRGASNTRRFLVIR